MWRWKTKKAGHRNGGQKGVLCGLFYPLIFFFSFLISPSAVLLSILLYCPKFPLSVLGSRFSFGDLMIVDFALLPFHGISCLAHFVVLIDMGLIILPQLVDRYIIPSQR